MGYYIISDKLLNGLKSGENWALEDANKYNLEVKRGKFAEQVAHSKSICYSIINDPYSWTFISNIDNRQKALISIVPVLYREMDYICYVTGQREYAFHSEADMPRIWDIVYLNKEADDYLDDQTMTDALNIYIDIFFKWINTRISL